MLGFIAAVQKVVNDLRADYTTARAAKLDNLDAANSTRAPASTALSSATWTNAKAMFLDMPISSAGFVIDPRKMPLCWHGNLLYYGGDTSNSIQTSPFFTSLMAWTGAYATVTASDTWTVICNLSGVSGFLCNAISALNSGSGLVSLRITVDGGAAVTLAATGTSRLLLGPVVTNTTSGGVAPGGAKVDGLEILSSSFVMTTPMHLRSLGAPVLRFGSSLLVETKVQTRVGTAPQDLCGVGYLLDK